MQGSVVVVRAEARPTWPAFRLPSRSGLDGVLRVRGGCVERLLRVAGEPVVVRCAFAGGRVGFEATARSRELAQEGIARMRFCLGVDDDLAPFHARFARDALIGAQLRRTPWLRVRRRPDPWEALAWAVTEQLIEYVRAAAIQRRMVRRFGERCAATGLRAVPAPGAVAVLAPAELQALDLAGGRARALVAAAREVAAGRADLRADPDAALRRLRAIRGIGRWTEDVVRLLGVGDHAAVPAGDHGLLRWAGRLLAHGDPDGYATEEQVREIFAPYEEWAGLAASYALRARIVALPSTPAAQAGALARAA